MIRYDSLHVATQYFHMLDDSIGEYREFTLPETFCLTIIMCFLQYLCQRYDLFVNQIANKKNTAIEYNPQAHIVTQQRQHTFADWLLYKQHCKHTGKYYKFKNRLALLYAASGFMFYCSPILALFLCINNTKYLYIIAALFTLRLISQYIVFGKIIHTLKKITKGILPFLICFLCCFCQYYKFTHYFIPLRNGNKQEPTKKTQRDNALIREALENNNQQAYVINGELPRVALPHDIKMVNNPYDAEDLMIESFGKPFITCIPIPIKCV